MTNSQEEGAMETEEPSQRKRKHSRSGSISVINLEQVDVIEKLYKEFRSFKSELSNEIKGVKEEVRLLRVEMLKSNDPEEENKKLDEVVEKMEAISKKIEKPVSVEDSSRKQLSSTTNLKEDLLKKLNQRKTFYYTFLHNMDRYKMYSGWAEQNPPYLPSKFIPVEINGEPEEEYLTRLKLKKVELECYLDRLKFRADSAKQKYEEIDNLVVVEIYDNNKDEDVIKKHVDWWNKRIKEEETLSKNIWEKKKAQIEKVPENQRNSGVIVSKDILYADVVRSGDVEMEEEPKFQVVRYRKNKQNNNRNPNSRRSNNHSTNFGGSRNRYENGGSRYNNQNGNQRFNHQDRGSRFNNSNRGRRDTVSDNTTTTHNDNRQTNAPQMQNREVNQSSGRGGTQQNFRRRGFPQRGRTWSRSSVR